MSEDKKVVRKTFANTHIGKVKRYLELKKQSDSIKDEMDKIKDEFKEFLLKDKNGNDFYEFFDGNVHICDVYRQTIEQMDSKRLKEMHPDIHKKFLKDIKQVQFKVRLSDV